MPKVSALVSTYNSERFIAGCLDDLISQSLYREGGLEIVVVVSGSEQGEKAVVEDYQKRFSHIVLLHTERETMYQAWNRGIHAAAAPYLTNANTDDRHNPDAFTRLARALDANSGLSLVYGDCYLSTIPNETFAENQKQKLYRYPQFFAPAAVLHYQFSPQPLWRRAVHDTIGYFSDILKTAGDYDFNLRFALRLGAAKVPGPAVGLYLAHSEALSFADETLKRETASLMAYYRASEQVEAFYRQAGARAESSRERALLHVDMGTRALCYFPPWFGGNVHQEPEFALECFRRAYQIDSKCEAAANNLMISLAMNNEPRGAYEFGKQLEKQFDDLGATTRENIRLIGLRLEQGGGDVTLSMIPSGLSFPSQQELISV